MDDGCHLGGLDLSMEGLEQWNEQSPNREGTTFDIPSGTQRTSLVLEHKSPGEAGLDQKP